MTAFTIPHYAVEVVDTSDLTEEEWLAYRRQGIGGSDVATLMGLSPFATARDLYYDKLGLEDMIQEEDNWVAKEIGHRLEDLVAKLFTEKTGYPVFPIRKLFRHPDFPFMQANVDFFVKLPDGKVAILECKTSSCHCLDKWQDGAVPINYEWQCRHYMSVMNIDRAYIACMFLGTNQFVFRRIERDKDMERDMIEAQQHFWNDFVLAHVEPPYTESGDLILQSVRQHYGELDGTADTVILDPAFAAVLEQYLLLSEQKRQFDKKVRELEKEMKKVYAPVAAALKNSCKGMVLAGKACYDVSWKPSYRTGICKDMLTKLEERHPEIYSEYTETKEIRAFSVKRTDIP